MVFAKKEKKFQIYPKQKSVTFVKNKKQNKTKTKKPSTGTFTTKVASAA